MRYFVRGDHEQARQFITKYQDRVLYATDYVLESKDGAEAVQELERPHNSDWKFFATKETLTFRNSQTQGLGLPEPVVRKIFRENAVRWLPGITAAA